jgi:hypothetical protein
MGRCQGFGYPIACLLSMSRDVTYQELLKEYQAALGAWTAARELYSPDGPPLIAAAVHLEEIENALDKFRTPLAA